MLNKQTVSKKTDGSKCQKAPRIPNDNIPIYKGNNGVHPAVYALALASGLFRRHTCHCLASEIGHNELILDLRGFVDLKGHFESSRSEVFELHEDKQFAQNFHRPVNAANGQQTKKIHDAARINAWSRQLPHGVNQDIYFVRDRGSLLRFSPGMYC